MTDVLETSALLKTAITAVNQAISPKTALAQKNLTRAHQEDAMTAEVVLPRTAIIAVSQGILQETAETQKEKIPEGQDAGLVPEAL